MTQPVGSSDNGDRSFLESHKIYSNDETYNVGGGYYRASLTILDIAETSNNEENKGWWWWDYF